MEGKQLYDYRTAEGRALEEQEARQQREHLQEAITLLANLGATFTNWEDPQTPNGEPNYYSPTALFEREYQQQASTTTRASFARASREYIEGIRDQVKRLASPLYFSKHPVSLYAGSYCEYLRTVEATGRAGSSGHGRPKGTEQLAVICPDKEHRRKLLAVLSRHQRPGEAAPAAAIIEAAKQLGYIRAEQEIAPLWRALAKHIEGLASDRAARKAKITPQDLAEFKRELLDA